MKNPLVFATGIYKLLSTHPGRESIICRAAENPASLHLRAL